MADPNPSHLSPPPSSSKQRRDRKNLQYFGERMIQLKGYTHDRNRHAHLASRDRLIKKLTPEERAVVLTGDKKRIYEVADQVFKRCRKYNFRKAKKEQSSTKA